MKLRIAPQFSLRVFLVAIMCLTLFVAAYAVRSHRQKTAVAGINALGGSVEYGPPISVNADQYLPLDFVATVEEVRCNRWDADGGHFVYDIRLMFIHLKRLPQLKRVLLFEINHGAEVHTLETMLPGVEIVVQRGGVVG